MAFHFFTDYDLLDHQEQIETGTFLDTTSSSPKYTAAFGKINYHPSLIGDYPAILLSSTHKSNSPVIAPRAYAICEGYIVVLPVKNSNLVNVILKPIEQPNLPLPKVKYYIYRGILRDSLFQDSNNNIPFPGFPTPPTNLDNFPAQSNEIIYRLADIGTTPATINNLVQSIRKTGGSSSSVSSSLDNQYNNLRQNNTYDSNYLDSLFVASADNTYPANWRVKGGWIIGNFPSSNNSAAGTQLDRYTKIPVNDTNFWYYYLNIFSLEIMLDTLDYNPTINLVKRNARVKISDAGDSDLENLGARNFNLIPIDGIGVGHDSSTKNRDFANRVSMEPALNYIDPAAFFGSFYSSITAANSADYDYMLYARKYNDPFDTTVDVDGVTKPQFTALTGNAIYEKILRGENASQVHFANRNRVYFDIRNAYNCSYNLYQDNCYNETGTSVTDDRKNLLFKINDGHTTVSTYERVLSAKNYYNRTLPWLFFDIDHIPLAACDDNLSHDWIKQDYFCNNIIADNYSVSLKFPTVGSPLKEQYSLLHLLDPQFLSKQRILLSTDNQLDSVTNSNIFSLHYNQSVMTTDEVKVMVNTYDSINGSITRRLPVACYYRFGFIKHRTFLDPVNGSTHHPEYPSNPTDPITAMKVLKRPQPVEFLDYVFNMDMKLTYNMANPGVLQNRAAEELRYADISRTTGWDMVAQSGVSQDSQGNMLFYVNGKYHRSGVNHNRANLADTSNTTLPINSSVSNTSNSFLRNLANTAAVSRYLSYSTVGGVELLESTGATAGAPNMPLEFFSFVQIPQADWILIQNYYNTLITGKKYHKVYLCFNQIDNSCSSPNRYKYYFKGYTVEQLAYAPYFDVVDIAPDGFMSSNPLVENRNRFPSFGFGRLAGNFFRLAGQPTNLPSSVSTSGTTLTLGSDVYLMRAMVLTYEKYYNRCRAIDRDLAVVYSSATNRGWNDALNAPLSDISAIVYQGSVLQSIPVKFIVLRHRDIVLFVTCKTPHSPRSSAVRGGRTAWLYMDDVVGQVVPDRYTPAHEYGHLLGLLDRYGYMARMTDATNNVIGSGEGTVPLYIQGDAQYNTNYRWHFNLMSNAKAVPSDFSTLPFRNDPLFLAPTPGNANYNTLQPTGTPDEYGYQNIAVFLTKEQLDVIRQIPGSSESAFFGMDTLFLFPANTDAASFTFIGAQNLDGTNFISDRILTTGTPSVQPDMATRRTSPTEICRAWVTYDPNNINTINNDSNMLNELSQGGVISDQLKTGYIGNRIKIGPSAPPPQPTGTNGDNYYDITRRIDPMVTGGAVIGGGIGDAEGQRVWNYGSGALPPIKYSRNNKFTITYQQHPNRRTIIRIIVTGS